MIGTNGQTILKLTKQYNVLIDIPSAEDEAVQITGKDHSKVYELIKELVDPKAKKEQKSVPTINIHSAHTYLKYRMYEQFYIKLILKLLEYVV